MLLNNVRCACRNLRAAPGFTVTAILSLALGIGATLAMFTVVNSILLKPLSFSNPERLVFITQSGTWKTSFNRSTGIAPIQFLRWRNEIQSFESLGLIRMASMNLTGSGLPETLGAARVSAGFLETLGVTPLHGRWFQRSEEKRGGPDVAIISAHLWRRRFSADPQIVGKKIVLDGVPYEVVGVTRPDLHFFRGQQLHPRIDLSEKTDVFLPLRFSVAQEQGAWNIGFLLIARLKPGVTPASVRAQLDSSLASFGMWNFAPGRYWTIVQPLQSALVGETSQALWLLLSAVGFLLLIACVNVTNLSLVRTVQRTRELAIRAALGASRRDLIGYSFIESLLLSLAGTAVGTIASLWITDAVVSRAPARIPRLDEVSVDSRVALFSVAVCVLTTILFGILPAWRASHVDPQQSLSTASHGNTDSRRSGRIRAALVSAEVALGTLLAIGSGLLLNSLHHMMTAPKGFEGDQVVIAEFALPPSKYQAPAAMERFFRGLRDQLSSTPGIGNIAAATLLPLEPERLAPILTEGPDTARFGPAVAWPAVSSEYLAAMGIPLRDGRFFREGEPEAVAVVSESAARLLWPGEKPIGKRICWPETPGKWLRVVGVAGDVLSAGLDRASTPAIYRPYSQYPTVTFRLVAQTALPAAFNKTLRDAVNRVDSDIPVSEIHTMSERIGKSAQQRVFQAVLLTVFAFAAVLLAAIGIYGVVANGIQQRRKEIGLRIALGADNRDVTHLVFRNGMAPVLAGLFAGVVMAMLLARLIASLLFQVGTLDLITFAGAPLVLAAAGAFPCWLTARQARRIDPAVCLRID
jgi:putative ABC transport system permease protein